MYTISGFFKLDPCQLVDFHEDQRRESNLKYPWYYRKQEDHIIDLSQSPFLHNNGLLYRETLRVTENFDFSHSTTVLALHIAQHFMYSNFSTTNRIYKDLEVIAISRTSVLLASKIKEPASKFKMRRSYCSLNGTIL